MFISRFIFLSILLLPLASFASSGNGAALFEGTQSFKNGGVACIACHNVNSPLIINGGTLAKDLTMYGGEAMAPTIAMMIGSADAMPSPLMSHAYRGHDITKEEADALVSFFKEVNPKSTEGGFANLFWIVGLFGAGAIFAGLTVLGKKKSQKQISQSRYV